MGGLFGGFYRVEGLFRVGFFIGFGRGVRGFVVLGVLVFIGFILDLFVVNKI